MGQPLETHIRRLQDFYWSDADPEGRGFVPLADALRRAGDLREAHRILREGLNRWPGYLSAHVVAAWVSRDRGEMDAAEASFRTAMDLDPRNVAVLRGLGEILAGRGELESALGLFRILQNEDPTDQGLLDRILELREELEAGGVGESAVEGRESVWADPEAAAEELSLEEATLQEDRPREEPGAEGESAGLAAEESLDLPEGELDDTLVTPTLAEIYVRQGLLDRAEEVYAALVHRDAENPALSARLEQIRGLRLGEDMVPEEGASPDIIPEEVFPIEALAPEGPEIVAIESLSPDAPAPIPVLSLAPEVPSIASLAPDEPGGPGIPGIDPEEIVPVEALSPDVVVSIESLAPEVPEDPTLDAFESWLEKLQ